MNVDLIKQKDLWRHMAAEVRNWGAPLLTQLCEGVAQDEDLLRIASHAPHEQPRVQFVSAVQYLLIRGAEHDLKKYFPSLNGGQVAAGNPFPLFRDFCLTHRDEIIKLISTKTMNTNEIARSAGLNAAFRTLALTAPEPFHLIEIGPSAGFNLLWDRYQIKYMRDGKTYATETPNPLLTVEVELRGGRIPPLGLPPKIASRIGLELKPVDLKNKEERDWLRAMVHPDHLIRLERLNKVLALEASDRPEIRGGDALKLLPQALAEIPAGGTICVYHTFSVYQFTREMQRELIDILTKASETRPIWRLSNEPTINSSKCPLLIFRLENGKRFGWKAAYCDIHGTWIEWLR